MKNKKLYEIVILGRGGQGAKSLGEMLAGAAQKGGFFTQAFPEFGPERSGAPVKAFVRISHEPIRSRQPIVDPDGLLVLDENLLEQKGIFSGLENNEPIIVNSALSAEELKRKWKLEQKVFPVDASGMAQHFLGNNFPNLGILGRFVFVTEKISLENALAGYENIYANKLDAKKIVLGKKIIQAAYHSI